MPKGTHIGGGTPAVPRGLRTAGAVALLALFAIVASIGRLVRFDDDVWRAVLTARGCGTDAAVDRIVEVATGLLFALIVIATLLHARRHGVRSVWVWTATLGLGLFAGTTMKHLLTRDRPTALPDVRLGYSFPSAHAMNSVIALLAVVALTRGLGSRQWWRSAAAASTIAVVVGRLVLARHWICDVAGGVLMALALAGLLVPAASRRALVAPAAVAGVLTVLYGVDRWMGDRGLVLPTPLVSRARAVIDLDLGAAADLLLTGGWQEADEEAPGGSLVWLEGAGSVAMSVPPTVVEAHRDRAAPLVVAFAGRPALPLPGCATVTVDVNGRALAAFVPFAGWREYRLPLPADVLRAGRNEVGLDVRSGARPLRFAVAYVRLAASRPD